MNFSQGNCIYSYGAGLGDSAQPNPMASIEQNIFPTQQGQLSSQSFQSLNYEQIYNYNNIIESGKFIVSTKLININSAQ